MKTVFAVSVLLLCACSSSNSGGSDPQGVDGQAGSSSSDGKSDGTGGSKSNPFKGFVHGQAGNGDDIGTLLRDGGGGPDGGLDDASVEDAEAKDSTVDPAEPDAGQSGSDASVDVGTDVGTDAGKLDDSCTTPGTGTMYNTPFCTKKDASGMPYSAICCLDHRYGCLISEGDGTGGSGALGFNCTHD